MSAAAPAAALTLKHRCIGALADAREAPAPLPLTDARAAHANRPIQFLSTIADGKGSAPGQASQYGDAAPEDDALAAEEGIDEYYDVRRYITTAVDVGTSTKGATAAVESSDASATFDVDLEELEL